MGLTTLSPSYGDCLEILGASTSWSPKSLSMPIQHYSLPFRIWVKVTAVIPAGESIIAITVVVCSSCILIHSTW